MMENVAAALLVIAALVALAWIAVVVVVMGTVFLLARDRGSDPSQDITAINPEAIDIGAAELENVARIWGVTPKWWHTDNRLRRMLADAMHREAASYAKDPSNDTSESYARMFPRA